MSNGHKEGEPLPQKPEPEKLVAAGTPSEIIPPGLDSALRTAGVDTADPNVTRALEVSLNLMMVRGSLPLPPPSVLGDYAKVFPGLVDKIVEWTDGQRTHRQNLERAKSEGSEKRMNRGQAIAALVAIIGLTLSAVVGVIGNPYVASVIAIVAIGGPTAAVWLARGGLGANGASAPKPKTDAKP